MQMYNKYDLLVVSERMQRSSSRNEIDSVRVADFARRKSEKTGVVGVPPGLANAIEEEFIHPTMQSTDKSVSMTEDLYSARGSQSAIVSEWVRKNLGLDREDIDSRFLLETFSNKWGNKFYEIRPQSAVAMFGSFHVKDTML